MAAKVRERQLQEKLDVIRKSRNVSAKVVEKLDQLIRQGADLEVFRINPVRFASDQGLIEHETIDAFLHGVRQGLFQMEWNLVCPTCGDSVDTFRSLGKVTSHFHCALCTRDADAALDDYIQVTFTISPEIREIAFHKPETLNIEDFHFKYHFSRTASLPGGLRFVDALPGVTKGQSWLGPGQKKRFDVEVSAGSLTLNDLLHHQSGTVAIKGTPVSSPQSLTARLEPGKLVLERSEVAPGKVLVLVENRTDTRASMLVLNPPPELEKVPLAFESLLTGRRLISTQTFRELFSSEVIPATQGLGVRDITILFTDLKGSTALYDRIGDLKAFSLVHQHFDRLSRVIAENSGAFIKTIGDAVMASFLNPVDAVKAAREMNREITRFNRAFTRRDVILKIGIHKGPCIAVTLNDRLDYFGQTVNIAARVQGLAGADEIWVTGEVLGYPGVRALLKGCRLFGGKARLKGLTEQTPVYKIVAAGEPSNGSAPLRASAARAASKPAP